MWKAYKVNGLQLLTTTTNELGQEVEVPYTISQDMLKELKVNIKIEITPRSPYDRYAQEQSLENLMINEKITFEEYVEALEQDSVMPKGKLEKILKKREEKKQQIQQMELQANQQQAILEQQMIVDEKNETNKQYDNMQTQAIEQYNNLVNTVGG